MLCICLSVEVSLYQGVTPVVYFFRGVTWSGCLTWGTTDGHTDRHDESISHFVLQNELKTKVLYVYLSDYPFIDSILGT